MFCDAVLYCAGAKARWASAQLLAWHADVLKLSLAMRSLAQRGSGVRGGARRYSQAGTPQVTVASEYDAAARTFTLHASQRTPATPGQSDKGPVPIPIAVGLLGADGHELPLHLQVGNVLHNILLSPCGCGGADLMLPNQQRWPLSEPTCFRLVRRPLAATRCF